MQFSIHLKEQIMKQLRKIAVGAVASLGLGLAVAAFAQPGSMGNGAGQKMGGMQERMAGMMQGSMHGSSADPAAAPQLMTAPEREALQEKMRAAP